MNEGFADKVTPSSPQRALPTLSLDIVLNTEFSRRVYKRCFDHLKGDLYVLTVRSLAFGLNEQAQVAETTLTEAFAHVRRDLDSELERTDVLLDHLKVGALADYEGVEPIHATYSTPRAREFLDLLLKMDQLLMRYEVLWLSGHIETQQRMTRSRNWQQRLIKMANRLRESGNRTRAALTRESDRRSPAAASGSQSQMSSESATTETEAPADMESIGAEANDGPDALIESASDEFGPSDEAQSIDAVESVSPGSVERSTSPRATRPAQLATG